MRIRVEAYSGYRANERPLRFWIHDASFEVQEILDTWYGPDHRYWKIKADDGRLYMIKYDVDKDQWVLEWIKRQGSGFPI
jgi:hypothetical protein